MKSADGPDAVRGYKMKEFLYLISASVTEHNKSDESQNIRKECISLASALDAVETLSLERKPLS